MPQGHPKSELMSKRIQVLLTPADKTDLERYAAAYNVSMSRAIRDCIRQTMDCYRDAVEEMSRGTASG